MIGAVEIAGSPITDVVMECLYGPHCPKKTTALTADTRESHPKENPSSMAKKAVDIVMVDGAYDPFGPLVFEEELMDDSILDDILDEEGGIFLTDIETVGLLPSEFCGAKGQPKELEDDFFPRRPN